MLDYDDKILLAAGCSNGDIALHDIGTIDMSNIPGKKKN